MATMKLSSIRHELSNPLISKSGMMQKGWHSFYSVPTSSSNLHFIVSLFNQSPTMKPEYNTTDDQCNVDLNELVAIRKSLSAWNLEKYIDEIVYNIFGKPFVDVRQHKGISHWSQEMLVNWILSLKCLRGDSEKLVNGIIEECVDGETFPILISLNADNTFKISYVSLLIINAILLTIIHLVISLV